MKINKELTKGSTVTLVLTLLNRKSMYGYEMIKEINNCSDGVFSFKEGTLYPILHTLESQGAIESYWDEEGRRKRKYYRITSEGKKYLQEKKEEWLIFRSAVDRIIGEGNAL